MDDLNDVQMVDFRGNVFKVGDTVVYPRQFGQTLEMQEGVVLEFIYKDDKQWRDGRWHEGYYKVRIRPTHSSRYNDYRDIDARPVLITNSMNIVKVTTGLDTARGTW